MRAARASRLIDEGLEGLPRIDGPGEGSVSARASTPEGGMTHRITQEADGGFIELRTAHARFNFGRRAVTATFSELTAHAPNGEKERYYSTKVGNKEIPLPFALFALTVTRRALVQTRIARGLPSS